MKKNLINCAIALAIALAGVGSSQARESFYGPTETIYWDAANSQNGYTLFGSGGVSYLIDMQGYVVHTWKIGTNPRLTLGGTLLDAAGGDPSNSNTWKELDWNGNVVWTYTESRKGYYPHHDFDKIYNKKLGDSTFIYIANKDLTSQQCLDAGCDPANTKNYTGAQMDVIVEVDKQGNVIWEWSFFNHVVQDINKNLPTYGVIKDNPGKINLNLRGNPVKSDWLHCNSLDYNEDLDYIVINSVHGEFYVIDHGGTFVKGDAATSISNAASSKGDFLYRFGDPAKYAQGDAPSVLENWEKATSGHKQIGGAHNIQWIKKGLPGEGNFLIFNNAENLFELTPQSYIMEINPYLNSTGQNTGKYVNPPTAGYNVVNSPDRNLMKEKKNVSKQVVWSYSSKANTSFYSTIGSSAQRLPNGNTLVCSMNDGHFFEVNPKDTSIVWEYINPFTRGGIKKIIGDNYPTYNAAFRAYRYTADHPALKGKTLTGSKTITGKTPDFITPETINAVFQPHESIEAPAVNTSIYPNPAKNSAKITFNLDNASKVKISIYSANGSFIKEITNEYYQAGTFETTWDATDSKGEAVSPGSYYFTVATNSGVYTNNVIIIK